jgi:hypothetical protein
VGRNIVLTATFKHVRWSSVKVHEFEPEYDFKIKTSPVKAKNIWGAANPNDMWGPLDNHDIWGPT